MEKIKISRLTMTFITQFILTITSITIIASILNIVNSRIYIKDLPGIEESFFNNFQVNGVSVLNTAYLSWKGIYSSFLGNGNFSGYWILFWTAFALLSIVLGPVFRILAYTLENLWSRFWCFWTSFFNIALLIFIIIGLSTPMNKDVFNQTFENQVFDYFGRDFFNTPELQEQFQLLKLGIGQTFSYNQFLIENAIEISLASISILAILLWLLHDHFENKFDRRKQDKNDVLYEKYDRLEI
ncbi:hypothetical protein [Spiroplasma alleghenense]|uniref:Transmembrane protein n=1 Tax=Spiroplasma alleghenense TaxID=216931 RepID=A0A345Z4R4_9MOLU|nr:hypothetical protein [Spiroplasma alleghenense]AXK51593.1 hypothetical protein SALLE_v1c09230 [Spiroplasma alleghenense]